MLELVLYIHLSQFGIDGRQRPGQETNGRFYQLLRRVIGVLMKSCVYVFIYTAGDCSLLDVPESSRSYSKCACVPVLITLVRRDKQG